jgi:hypothetical protein
MKIYLGGQACAHTVVSYICDNEKFSLGQYKGLTPYFTWTTYFPVQIYLIICTLVLSAVVDLSDKQFEMPGVLTTTHLKSRQ